MGTEVLRPQNCFRDRLKDSPAGFQRRRNNVNRKHPVRVNHHRKRFGSDTFSDTFNFEKVTILRRGQSFDSISKMESFAGSTTVVVSPSPSSLPLPSFWRNDKRKVVVVQVNDSASRDLRRLLRMEF